MRSEKVAKIGLVTLALSLLIGICIYQEAFPPVPTDQELLTLFHDHCAAFEQLRRLVLEDEGHESFFSVSELDPKMPSARIKEYERLLSELGGVEIGIDHLDGILTIRFLVSGGGVSAMGAGWVKGIKYIQGHYERQGTLLDNLDHAEKWPADSYLRRIEDHWFLFYERLE